MALQSNKGPPAQPGASKDCWICCLIQQARHLLLRRQCLARLPAYFGALVYCSISPHSSLRHPRHHLRCCFSCRMAGVTLVPALRCCAALREQESPIVRRRHSPAPDMHLTATSASKAHTWSAGQYLARECLGASSAMRMSAGWRPCSLWRAFSTCTCQYYVLKGSLLQNLPPFKSWKHI